MPLLFSPGITSPNGSAVTLELSVNSFVSHIRAFFGSWRVPLGPPQGAERRSTHRQQPGAFCLARPAAEADRVYGGAAGGPGPHDTLNRGYDSSCPKVTIGTRPMAAFGGSIRTTSPARQNNFQLETAFS